MLSVKSCPTYDTLYLFNFLYWQQKMNFRRFFTILISVGGSFQAMK